MQNNIILSVPTSDIESFSEACDFVISNKTLINYRDGTHLESMSDTACPTSGLNTITINFLLNHSIPKSVVRAEEARTMPQQSA